MANHIFPKAKQKLMEKVIDLKNDTIKIVLIKDTYVYDGTHEFLSDIGANTLGTAVSLASKTTDQPTPGVYDADNPTFTAVPGGSTANAYIIYADYGSAATDRLIFYNDGTTGFPLSTTGGNVDITFDSGANRIFAL